MYSLGKIWLLSLVLFFSSSLVAQFLPDSLMNQYEQADDTTKLMVINNFVQKNYRSQAEICSKAIVEAIKLGETIGANSYLAHSYSMAGVLEKNKGEYSTALDYHYKSLKLNELLNDRRALASNYNDIGIIYKTTAQYDKALESYHLANSLAVELNLKRGIVMTLSNIGTIYEAKNKFKEAIFYYNSAYDKAIEFNITDAQAIVLNNLGEIYASNGKTVTAREFFSKTLKLDQQTGDKIGSVYSMINIAGTFVGTKDWDSAVIYYKSAEDIAKELRANQLLQSIYSSLAQMYQEKHDYKLALENYLTSNIYKDSLFNETSQKQMAEVEAKYKASQKDNEIQILKQEKLIKDIEVQQHQAENIALISLLVLGTIIIFVLYKRHQAKQNAVFNAKLLAQKEDNLRAVVVAQEEERKRIAKDLHDGIGQQLSGVRLGLASMAENNELGDKSVQTMRNLTSVLDHTIQDVRNLSHQMMPRILQEDGLIPALEDMLDKTFRYSPIQYHFEHFGVDKRFAEQVEIGLYRITQELINNIIKHSEATQVSVQLLKNGKILVLLVEDNGKGFKTMKEKQKGIGLMNITSRVETIHGEFNLQPSPESGMLATVRIPVES